MIGRRARASEDVSEDVEALGDVVCESGARSASTGRVKAGTVADECTLDGEKIKD